MKSNQFEWCKNGLKAREMSFKGMAIVLYEKGKLLADKHNAKVDELARKKH